MKEAHKLYLKASSSFHNFDFVDLCKLAMVAGFEYDRTKGSHRIFKHPMIKSVDGMINFQNDGGKAKSYQIKQLIELIDKYNLI